MSSSSHAMPFSATEAICFSGGKRLNHLGKKSLLKAKKSSAKVVVVRAIQTPKKPTATTSGGNGESKTTFSKNQTEEKEAYPFEKEYRDCACCWCRLYLLSTIVFSLSLSRGRERPYLFFRLFALVVDEISSSFFFGLN
jgi:hypothetical protein